MIAHRPCGSHFLHVALLAAALAAERDVAADPVGVIRSVEELKVARHDLNSHARETSGSGLELDFRTYRELSSVHLGINDAQYPRLKKTANGTFVLLFQDGRIGRNVFYATSRNLAQWAPPQKLFSAHAIADGKDERRYTTADAVVLRDGSILAVCSYRANKGFSTRLGENGLMMRRSTDDGATWAAEQVIYVGPNWEPYILSLPSGEVQVYFTQVAPKMALEHTLHSSGVGLIRSLDGGKTWVPRVTGHPFAAQRIAQQYRFTTENGVRVFTDQMPCAIVLNDGTSIALALESRQQNEKHKISFAYSPDNWSRDLALDEIGPRDHTDNLWWGGAPYLRQFSSGESVVGYNFDDQYTVRVGNVEARDFGAAYIPLPGRGYWGALELVGPHTLMMTMPIVAAPGGSNLIMLAALHLNHRIDAPYVANGVSGVELPAEADALFVGSDSQAQMTIRAAHNANDLFLHLERLDRSATPDDREEIFLRASAANDDFVHLDLDSNGIRSVSRRIRGAMEVLAADRVGISAMTRAGHDSQNGSGLVVDVRLPLSLISPYPESLRFDCIVFNRDETGPTTADTFTGTSVEDQGSWIPIRLAKAR